MVLYRPLIDSLVSQTAKTTPLPERRSRAWEAFCEALNTYTAGQGIGSFLRGRMKGGKTGADNTPLTADVHPTAG